MSSPPLMGLYAALSLVGSTFLWKAWKRKSLKNALIGAGIILPTFSITTPWFWYIGWALVIAGAFKK